METAREAILRATMKGVRLYGLHGVRIRHISELAGVLPSSIYGYFKGKEDLLQACFQRVTEQIAGMMQQAKPRAELLPDEPQDAMREFWVPFYRWLINHPDETVFFHRYCDGPNSPLNTIGSEQPGDFVSAMSSLAKGVLPENSDTYRLLWLHGVLGTVRYAKYVIEGFLPDNAETEAGIFYLTFPGLKN